jgi:hypothetical protein
MENAPQPELSKAKAGRLRFRRVIAARTPVDTPVGGNAPDVGDFKDGLNRWSDELAGSSGGDS